MLGSATSHIIKKYCTEYSGPRCAWSCGTGCVSRQVNLGVPVRWPDNFPVYVNFTSWTVPQCLGRSSTSFPGFNVAGMAGRGRRRNSCGSTWSVGGSSSPICGDRQEVAWKSGCAGGDYHYLIDFPISGPTNPQTAPKPATQPTTQPTKISTSSAPFRPAPPPFSIVVVLSSCSVVEILLILISTQSSVLQSRNLSLELVFTCKSSFVGPSLTG